MPHALIIDDNPLVARLMAERLRTLGFDSCECRNNEEQAVAAARRQPPDLVVVGDSLKAGSPLDAARRIAAEHDVPMLMATASAPTPAQVAARGASLQGPFRLADLPAAVGRASRAGAAAEPTLGSTTCEVPPT